MIFVPANVGARLNYYLYLYIYEIFISVPQKGAWWGPPTTGTTVKKVYSHTYTGTHTSMYNR